MQIKTILWLFLFSVAMGYMESAVVIYLRKIYYPHGFQFPLVALEAGIGFVELLREAATIIMLLIVGVLAAQTVSLRFAGFLFCFAVWDICYYIFLWIFLDWPESLFTWDILFLIPVPWVGPVLTPCIVSITMLILSTAIIYFQNRGLNIRLNFKEWMLLTSGSFVIILSFVWDYLNYINRINDDEIVNPFNGEQKMLSDMMNYVPADFNWPLFLTGESILLCGVALFIFRIRKLKMLSLQMLNISC